MIFLKSRISKLNLIWLFTNTKVLYCIYAEDLHIVMAVPMKKLLIFLQFLQQSVQSPVPNILVWPVLQNSTWLVTDCNKKVSVQEYVDEGGRAIQMKDTSVSYRTKLILLINPMGQNKKPVLLVPVERGPKKNHSRLTRDRLSSASWGLPFYFLQW